MTKQFSKKQFGPLQDAVCSNDCDWVGQFKWEVQRFLSKAPWLVRSRLCNLFISIFYQTECSAFRWPPPTSPSNISPKMGVKVKPINWGFMWETPTTWDVTLTTETRGLTTSKASFWTRGSFCVQKLTSFFTIKSWFRGLVDSMASLLTWQWVASRLWPKFKTLDQSIPSYRGSAFPGLWVAQLFVCLFHDSSFSGALESLFLRNEYTMLFGHRNLNIQGGRTCSSKKCCIGSSRFKPIFAFKYIIKLHANLTQFNQHTKQKRKVNKWPFKILYHWWRWWSVARTDDLSCCMPSWTQNQMSQWPCTFCWCLQLPLLAD